MTAARRGHNRYPKKKKVLHPPVYVGSVGALIERFELHEEFVCAGCGNPSKSVAGVFRWPLAGPKAHFLVCPGCEPIPKERAERDARAQRIAKALTDAAPLRSAA